MPDAQRIRHLRDCIADYLELIKTFERERIELQRRRAAADAQEATWIDTQLFANQRGLDLMEQALTKLRERLEDELRCQV